VAEPGVAPRRRLFFLRRILPLLIVLAGALWFFRDAPRDVTLAMDLAGRRDGLVALRFELWRLPDRTLARHVELFYSPSSPPPTHLRSVVHIPPGDYRADLAFDFGARVEHLERAFSLDRQEEIVLAP